MSCDPARVISRLPSGSSYVGHSPFRLGLAESCSRGYESGEVGLVWCGHILPQKRIRKDEVGFGAEGRVVRIGLRLVGPKQRIDKISISIQRCFTRRTRRVPCRASRDRRRSGGEEHNRDHQCNRPNQKAVCGIAEVHFVSVNGNPLGAQPACQIPAYRRRNNLNYDQPEDRSDPTLEDRKPALGQGEIEDNPIPVPNASKIRDKAAVQTAPAMTAAQETPDEDASILGEASR